MTVIGASLSEPHINGYFNVRSVYNIARDDVETSMGRAFGE